MKAYSYISYDNAEDVDYNVNVIAYRTGGDGELQLGPLTLRFGGLGAIEAFGKMLDDLAGEIRAQAERDPDEDDA